LLIFPVINCHFNGDEIGTYKDDVLITIIIVIVMDFLARIPVSNKSYSEKIGIFPKRTEYFIHWGNMLLFQTKNFAV
jgi:hypothetical protein